MQTIEVTNCAECPFSRLVLRYGVYDCNASDKQMEIDFFDSDKGVWEFCPLKQQSITVKLAENEQQAMDRTLGI